MPNRLASLALIALLAGLFATACERAEPSVFGSWIAADPDTEWTVHIAEDSTWSMQAGTMEGEGRLSAAEEEGTVVLHTTGRMADVMPGGFRAHLEQDTLQLCSVAGCEAMVRDR